MKKIKLEDVPLEHRFIETVSPGFLFGVTCEMKWPKQSWTNAEAVAKELLQKKELGAVGFMRFVYDSACGKTCLDDGWQYFKGKKFTKEECLDGTARKEFPDIPLNDIALSNIKCNNWDALYIPECKKLWPLHREDRIVV